MLLELKNEAETKPSTSQLDENLFVKNEPGPVESNSMALNESSNKQSPQTIRGESSESGRNVELELLREQLERVNQVFITIPDRLIQSEQNQRELFQKICERLNVNVPLDQIVEACREDNALVIKFRELKFKEMIMESADGKKVWLDQIINGEKSWRIHVRHYMTRYYSKLYGAAQDYKERRFLHSFKLTDKGLVVKGKESSKGKLVLSMRDLNDYINTKKA